jgi:tetratricopeptide (TPR) repeat protein
MCDALAAAHEAGIIHRDLKSANIVLLERAGQRDFVKVLDFGICKHFDDESTLKTTPGLVMGSPDYMAPEQAAGAPADVKSDIYAVGTIAFEMLTGRLPFEGRNAIDVLMQKGGRRAPSVNEFAPKLGAPLAALVAACLHRSLDERPNSMRELEVAFARAVDGRAEAELELAAARSGAHARPSSASHPALVLPSVSPSGSQPRLVQTDNFMTVHGQALASGQHAAVKSAWWASGLKAFSFVALGVAVAVGSFYALKSDDAPSLAGADPVNPIPPSAESDLAPPAALAPEAAKVETAEAETVAAESADDLVLDPDERSPDENLLGDEGAAAVEENPAIADDPAILAERAQAAFDNKHWREPAGASLAIELANLGLIDPGNEAISRLRKATAVELMPQAGRAFRRKRWGDAVAAFRDLFAVWPDYDEDARKDFATALRNQGRILRRLKDHEGALATADELLNVKPGYFTALKLRADSLASLGRWEEAVPAYRAAMRARPSSKDAKKGYWRARGKLKHK